MMSRTAGAGGDPRPDASAVVRSCTCCCELGTVVFLPLLPSTPRPARRPRTSCTSTSRHRPTALVCMPSPCASGFDAVGLQGELARPSRCLLFPIAYWSRLLKAKMNAGVVDKARTKTGHILPAGYRWITTSSDEYAERVYRFGIIIVAWHSRHPFTKRPLRHPRGPSRATASTHQTRKGAGMSCLRWVPPIRAKTCLPWHPSIIFHLKQQSSECHNKNSAGAIVLVIVRI